MSETFKHPTYGPPHYMPGLRQLPIYSV